jgi:hypothetical protein
MNAFEQLVSEILWMEGYWVQTSVKVELSKEEKRLIGRHSAPRWELDIVAYSGRKNSLWVVECKSYLDSVGVRAAAFDGTSPLYAKNYKLFNEPKLRQVVFRRLQRQLTATGACRKIPKVHLALAAGKIRNEADRKAIRARFKKHGWELRQRLQQMSQGRYENQISAVVAKLLLRDKVRTEKN